MVKPGKEEVNPPSDGRLDVEEEAEEQSTRSTEKIFSRICCQHYWSFRTAINEDVLPCKKEKPTVGKVCCHQAHYKGLYWKEGLQRTCGTCLSNYPGEQALSNLYLMNLSFVGYYSYGC